MYVSVDDKGRTSLHVAAYFGWGVVIRDICKLGTNVNISTLDGRTPVFLAAQEGQIDTIRLLYGSKLTLYLHLSVLEIM